jgi:sigma-E factor negative regulatory protein RseC
MTETEATVVALSGNDAIVRTESQGGCGRCHEPGGCGGQSLSQMFCAKPREYALPNTVQAAVGDKVVLGVPEGVLNRTAMLAYVLPVVGVLLGAVLGRAWAGSNSAAVTGAALGLFLGWLWLRRRRTVTELEGQLQILRKVL